jgi:hypothetical protein
MSSKIPKGKKDARKRTVLVARGGSIQRGILVPHDKHRNLGPILTLIPDLLRNEFIRWQTLDFRSSQRPPLLLFLEGVVESVLVNERRVGEARKGGEEPRVFSPSRDRGLSDETPCKLSDPLPILEIVDVDLVFHLPPQNQHHRVLHSREGNGVRLSCIR